MLGYLLPLWVIGCRDYESLYFEYALTGKRAVRGDEMVREVSVGFGLDCCFADQVLLLHSRVVMNLEI